MKLHHLRPAEGSKKRKIRVGRGQDRHGKSVHIEGCHHRSRADHVGRDARF